MSNFGGKPNKTGLGARLLCLILCLQLTLTSLSCATAENETAAENTHECVFNLEAVEEKYLKLRAESCLEESLYYLSCSCGKAGEEAFSVGYGEHLFTERAEGEYLFAEATENASAVYYLSCKYCGEKCDETFSYGDPLWIFKNRKILVFGDSYSAYKGYVPQGYEPGYPSTDVNTVWEMWWAHLVKKTNSVIVRNDCWNGSTLGFTGYYGSDCSKSTSFIARYRHLKGEGFFDRNEIDTVIIFGGTNDCWSNAPLGEMKLSGFTDADLYYVLPAICYFAYTLSTDLPDAKILFVINDGLKPEIQDCMEAAAEYYGINSVRLHDVDKINRHPTAAGMLTICDQIFEAIDKS